MAEHLLCSTLLSNRSSSSQRRFTTSSPSTTRQFNIPLQRKSACQSVRLSRFPPCYQRDTRVNHSSLSSRVVDSVRRNSSFGDNSRLVNRLSSKLSILACLATRLLDMCRYDLSRDGHHQERRWKTTAGSSFSMHARAGHPRARLGHFQSVYEYEPAQARRRLEELSEWT